MKKIYKSLIFPLVFLMSLTTSCGQEIAKFEEYYDSSWTPGENALQTNQPSVKNPNGKYGLVNEIKRTQNKVGLPSQGQGNLLVVPVTFLGDKELEQQTGVDLTFNDFDLEQLNNVYFKTTKKANEYPSVKMFYEQSSFGKLKLDGVVSPVVELPKEYTDYLMKAYTSSIESAHLEIIDYVYNYLFEETKTYYVGDFDSDNDKKIDGISIIINYSYYLDFGSDNLNSLNQAFLDFNNVYYSKDLTLPINSCSLISDSFRFKSTFEYTDSHAHIHQVGKMIGLNDYIDRNYNLITGTMRAPIGFSDPLSGLSGDHNAFSKYQLGWTSPRFIKASDIPSDGLKITLNSAITTGESIVLHTGNHSMFGEYLMLDLYTLEGVNKYDAENSSLYGLTGFDKAGVRVYQVDSRLVRGYGDTFVEYRGKPDFNAKKELPNGIKVPYVYDYAYTNSSQNPYASSGISDNYALVSLLSKKGANRHMTDYSQLLDSNDLFLAGDAFGLDSQIDGFYKDFKFHNNEALGITFTVDAIEENVATITLRRAK